MGFTLPGRRHLFFALALAGFLAGGPGFVAAGQPDRWPEIAHWEMHAQPEQTGILLRWESAPAVRVKTLEGGGLVLEQGEMPLGGKPGEPRLPFRRLRFLAPPDADLAKATVELTGARWEELGDGFRIAPAPPRARQEGEKAVLDWAGKDPSLLREGRDEAIYSSDKEFPASPIEITHVGQYREWKLVDVVVHPLRYRPLSGKVYRLAAGDIAVRFPSGAENHPESVAAPRNPAELERLMEGVLNGADRDRLYASVRKTAAVCDVVLVTTEDIWCESAYLQSWVGQREAVGWKVRVVLDGYAEDDEHFLRGSDCECRAANIRSWLKQRYQSWGFSTVFLVGNPAPVDILNFDPSLSIPMKAAYPGGETGGVHPTDMFYADLSGNWDLNGNGFPGEWVYDMGAGGADRFCELSVGRVPIYALWQIDSLFYGLLRHGAVPEPPLARDRIIIGGSVSNFAPQDNDGDGVPKTPNDFPYPEWRTFGADWGEALKQYVQLWGDTPYTLYERDGCHNNGTDYPLTPCDAPLSYYEITYALQQGAGYMALWGHGNSTGIYRTRWLWDTANPGITDAAAGEISQVTMLDSSCADVIPEGSAPFVTLVACQNAWPEASDNLASTLLWRKAPGVFAATRNSLYQVGAWSTGLMHSWGDNASYGYSIYGGIRCGFTPAFALNSCRAEFGLDSGCAWTNMLIFNYYGDPCLGLLSSRYPLAAIPQPDYLSKWPAGATMNIQWTTENWPGSFADGPVRLDITRDRGLTWETIIPTTSNDGQEQWVVTGPASNGCRLRLVNGNKPEHFYTHWNDFIIQEISVSQPAAQSLWPIGSTQTIQWYGYYIADGDQSACVEINRNYPSGSWETLFPNIKISSQSVPWVVTGPGSGNCRIRVRSLHNAALVGLSGTFTIPSLTLTAPVGGETWRLYAGKNITWTSAWMSGNVRIRLLRNTSDSASWETLAASTPNDGGFSWTVTPAPSSSARIELASVDLPSLTSTATIRLAGIAPTSPEQGDDWVIDGNHTIEWDSVDVPGHLKIEINRSYPSGTWETLLADTPNDGAEPWKVTGPAASACRLRFTSIADPSFQAVSPFDFQISNAPLKLFSPNGGENWPVGKTVKIGWSSTIAAGNVSIAICRNYPYEGWTPLFANIANDGVQPWTVTGPIGSRIRLKVYSVAYPTSITDGSDANFTISRNLEVTSPNGGEELYIGGTAAITWSAGAVEGDVAVELNRNYPSGSWETLFAAVPASAQGQNWTVTGPASAACAVRLTNGAGKAVALSDESDATFSISDKPSLSLLEPAAGSTWVSGTTHLVTWSSTGKVGGVSVEFQRNRDTRWEPVSTDTTNNGFREVSIALGSSSTAQARMRVVSLTDPGVASVSGDFSVIPAATLALRSPYGGEKWTVGTSRDITWVAAGIDGNVRLELNRSYPEGSWEFLMDQAAGGGRASWTATGPVSAHCRIRVSDPLHGDVQSVSSGDFSLLNPVNLATVPANLTVQFLGVPGGEDPPPQTFSLSQDGESGLTWSLSPKATWLSVSPERGTLGPELQPLVLRASPGELWPGVWRSGLTVEAAGATNSPLTVPVELVLVPTGDLNQDGRTDALDLAVLALTLRGVFTPGRPPCAAPRQGDFDASGALDAADHVLLMRYLGGEGMAVFAPWLHPDM